MLNARLLLAANGQGWTPDQFVDGGYLPSPSDMPHDPESTSPHHLASTGQIKSPSYADAVVRHTFAGTIPSIAVHCTTPANMAPPRTCSPHMATPHSHAVIDFQDRASNRQGHLQLDDHGIDIEYVRPDETRFSALESDCGCAPGASERNPQTHDGSEQAVSQIFRNSFSPGLATQRDNLGRTALHEAAINGHVSVIMQILAAQGASHEVLQSTDNEGKTALHLAARHGQIEVVKLLLEEEGRLYHTGGL
ncbi:hypothetical protein BDW75DRAFT_245418 [Aspergillus navahoensis]